MAKPSPFLFALIVLGAFIAAFALDPLGKWGPLPIVGRDTSTGDAQKSSGQSAAPIDALATKPREFADQTRFLESPPRIATERGRGRVTGQVLTRDHRPLIGAEIRLFAITSPKLQSSQSEPSEIDQLEDDLRWREAHQFQTLTDGNGSYRLEELPGDVFYRMEARAPGYLLRILQTFGPSVELIPPAEVVWIAEPATPLALRLMDEQGALIPAAKIRYRPYDIEVPILLEELPPLDAGQGTEEFLWTPTNFGPPLTTSWYLLQAISLDARLRSKVLLHLHQAGAQPAPRDIALRGGARIQVRLESLPKAGTRLEDLVVAQVAIPEALPETAIDSFLSDALFGNSKVARETLRVGKEREFEFLRVPEGRNAVLLAHRGTILEQQILAIQGEDSSVTLSGRAYPEPKLRTLQIEGLPQEELDSLEIHVAIRQNRLGELRIYDIGPSSLRIYEPENEAIMRREGYTLVGVHPRLGVAELLLDETQVMPWRLQFGLRSDLQLSLLTPSPHPEYHSALNCKIYSKDAQFQVERLISEDSHFALGNLPQRQLSLAMRARLTTRNRYLTNVAQDGVPYFSGEIPLPTIEISLIAVQQKQEVVWPDGGPLTIFGWAAIDPKPTGIVLTHADGMKAGHFEIFLPQALDGDIVIPWLPHGPWTCWPNAEQEIIHHRSASRIRLAPNAIMGWQIAHAPKDSQYVRSGGQSGDILLSWEGRPAHEIQQAIRASATDSPLADVQILRDGQRLTIKLSKRLSREPHSHWPHGFLGCRAKPLWRLPVR